MTKYLFLIAAILLFATNYAFGCKTILPEISSFEPTEYVFIGEVVEIVQFEGKPNSDKGGAFGLKIKVTDDIYSPKSASFYEVFPLHLTPACVQSYEADELKQLFPVGSQVRVVAKETTDSVNQPKKSIIRLDTSPRHNGSVARNDLSDNLQTSSKSIYDFKNYNYSVAGKLPENVLVESNMRLPEFEVRKDLLRLNKAKSEDERTQIIERLVFCPPYVRFSFTSVIQTYIKDSNKVADFEKQRKQFLAEIKLSKR